MRSIRASALLTAAALASACNDSTTPGDPPVFSIAPAAQWSGGEVEVTSKAVTGGALPVIVADAETLAVRRVGDSTVAVTLPRAPTSQVILRLGAGDSVGSVEVFGLRSARAVPGVMGYEPLVPAGITPLVFVAEGAAFSGSLTIFDPATDQVTTRTGISTLQPSWGIVPSVTPNQYALRDSTGAVGMWQLFPTPVFLEYAPRTYTSYHLSRFGANLWYGDNPTFIFTYHSDSSSVLPPLTLSSTRRLLLSPAGDRAALVVAASNGGYPVLDITTGDTAFTLRVPAVSGAAFSPTGDRLYLEILAPSAQADSLIAVAAGAGQRLGAVELPPGIRGHDLVADPILDRVYLLADSANVASLLVYDGSALTLEGRLPCGVSCPDVATFTAAVGVDVAAGLIHAVSYGSPIPVATFDRLP